MTTISFEVKSFPFQIDKSKGTRFMLLSWSSNSAPVRTVIQNFFFFFKSKYTSESRTMLFSVKNKEKVHMNKMY